ncbi:hypothetical protein MAPG_09930 [Magnaporthiopsis poae ATCC 64411]|uniref:Uncharacterized protein n=1 Tax=Magnaporthiopsis poae (strain ATCC 64411 / 73-15) TaxID=644358 RepID=A0A0C4EB83_MAGP6|nr:hypothetical protein MAPG_09930 [Magnaporthiopsis poae ATCC 64411]
MQDRVTWPDVPGSERVPVEHSLSIEIFPGWAGLGAKRFSRKLCDQISVPPPTRGDGLQGISKRCNKQGSPCLGRRRSPGRVFHPVFGAARFMNPCKSGCCQEIFSAADMGTPPNDAHCSRQPNGASADLQGNDESCAIPNSTPSKRT